MVKTQQTSNKHLLAVHSDGQNYAADVAQPLGKFLKL